jgi:general secretion pathway protein G
MKTNPARHPRNAAFTLMEMMLVLLIITLIIGSVALMFQNFSSNAQITTTEAKVRTLEAALMQYKTLNRIYPTQAQGLEALVTRPSGDPKPQRWSQFVKPEAIMDAWENKMQYRNPGKRNTSGYDVFSFGPDRVESGDDIGNW